MSRNLIVIALRGPFVVVAIDKSEINWPMIGQHPWQGVLEPADDYLGVVEPKRSRLRRAIRARGSAPSSVINLPAPMSFRADAW